MLDDEYVIPPGSIKQILSHPFYKYYETVELSMFNDHRFSFFFWNKWSKEIKGNPPCLVTLDWHQDLIFPDDTEKEWLNKLDLRSNYEVALFSWIKLRSLNDSHILAAAYLNLIGNIYVQCRQEFHNSWEDEFLTDRYGNAHRIIKFKDYNHIEQYLLNSDETQVYFDIDLDFFTLNNPLNGVGNKFTYIKEEAIKNMLNYNRPLINWIFKRLKGITIAKEPKHTGGMLKSNRLLSIINNCWFDNSLFLSYPCDYNRDTEWKHLKKK